MGAKSEGFEVIPAVDMKDGKCVQLTQGKEGTGKEYGEPVESAKRWVEEGAETLHLIDLNGAIHGERKNAEHVSKIIEETEVEVQVGGGIRTVEEAKKFFEVGVERVIMGTAAVENPEIVKNVSEHGDVMVSLDASEGEVVVEGWKKKSGYTPVELGEKFEDLGAESILYTNVDKEGLLEGVDEASVHKLVESVEIPVVASGGVSTIEDLKKLAETGAAGVVIGTAFYEGKISLAEAKKEVENK